MKTVRIELKDVDVNIPVLSGNQRRLIRKPLFLTSVGGNVAQEGGKIHIKALRNISFEINSGEHLALIGHNGAGKTTLLRVIADIYPPSRGSVIVEGKLGCMLEVGMGLTQEMTGYESITHQCLINGHPREKWKELEEELAEFTDLGNYLDLPVRTYSAGMKSRLMAGLATAWEHDILLIDEGIGAGDYGFQDKFRERLEHFMAKAGLLVIASHSLDFLRQYCSRAVVLVHGEIVMVGEIEEAWKFYQQYYR